MAAVEGGEQRLGPVMGRIEGGHDDMSLADDWTEPAVNERTVVARTRTVLGIGAALYTIGAVVYACRRPEPWPWYFCYHEVFHALVIAAVICHYVLIASVAKEPATPLTA
jgi:hypothetical protein